MRRADFLRLAAAGGTALALSSCSRGPDGDAPIKKAEHYFRYAENQTDGYPTTQAAYYFAGLVRERTDERIQILIYPNAALGDEVNAIEQVKLGMIDFARVSLATLSGSAPELNVLLMPYLYADADQMWRVLDGDIGEAFLEMLEPMNLCGLSWYDAGARSFYASDGPITCLEDMRGMRVRVQESALMSDMIRALGATPVTTVFQDVYSELQSGSIDAAENNWPSYESMGHYEVARYFTEDEHMRIPEMQIVSKTMWDALSEEDRQILRGAAQESAVYERQLWAQRVDESREAVLAAGAVANRLEPGELARFHAAMRPLYEQYCADYTDIVAEIRAT